MSRVFFILSVILNVLFSNPIYNDSWALIIGINKYQNAQNLDYAVNDAIGIKNVLINKYDFSEKNIITLLDDNASFMQIRKAFSNIAKQAKNNDRILMFYAGHGATVDLPEGGEMGYLVPFDGNPDDLFATSIPMDELKRVSLMTEAKHILFLVDVCYGGLAATGTRSLDPFKTPNYLEKITSDKSRQIITAGGKGEKVIEKSEWGHSAFTYNLIRGLEQYRADYNNDGLITAEELGVFLRDKVTIDSENQQTPQFRRMTSHEGEFVFVYDKNKKNINDLNMLTQSSYLQPEIDYDLLAEKIANKGSTYNSQNFIPQNHEFNFKKLESRKQRDFAGFLSVYLAGIAIDATDKWGFEYPQLLIPGIGPMLVKPDDETPSELLLIGSVLQLYFIWDYFKTSQKLKKYN